MMALLALPNHPQAQAQVRDGRCLLWAASCMRSHLLTFLEITQGSHQQGTRVGGSRASAWPLSAGLWFRNFLSAGQQLQTGVDIEKH